MTTKVRAYSGWADQAGDEISEWFWGQVANVMIVGIAISIPMFGWGALTAPAEVNRIDNGIETTLAGHSFVWEHAIGAVGAVAEPVMEYLNNGEQVEQ